ncbi:carbon-nitrogen hydrolase family protein [Vibrio sp. PP-XX7]
MLLRVAPWDSTVDPTERDVSAAAVQYQPLIGDKQANFNSVRVLVEKRHGVALAVLPEYSLTGESPAMPPELAMKWAEPIDGPTFKKMSQLAQASGINLVYSLIEKADDKLFVTAVVLDKNGIMLGTYRKTHLNQAEKHWAKAGDKITTVDLPDIGKLGVMLGEDVLYPEVAGILEEQRADIIAIPSSWSGEYGGYVQVNQKAIANPYPAHAMVLWDAVAFSAQAYTIVANFVGTENHYKGESALYTLDPLYGLDQASVASSTASEAFPVKFTTKHNKWSLNQFDMESSRRPYFYKPLIMKSPGSDVSS